MTVTFHDSAEFRAFAARIKMPPHYMISRALTLYEQVATHQQSGGEVVFVPPEGSNARMVVLCDVTTPEGDTPGG